MRNVHRILFKLPTQYLVWRWDMSVYGFWYLAHKGSIFWKIIIACKISQICSSNFLYDNFYLIIGIMWIWAVSVFFFENCEILWRSHQHEITVVTLHFCSCLTLICEVWRKSGIAFTFYGRFFLLKMLTHFGKGARMSN